MSRFASDPRFPTGKWTGERISGKQLQPVFPDGWVGEIDELPIYVYTPEPAAIRLALIGLALLPQRRRR